MNLLKLIKVCLYVFLLASIISCSNTVKRPKDNLITQYFCDAETIVNNQFINADSIPFGSANSISKNYSYSGNNSLLVDSLTSFGFSLKLNDVDPKERFEIEVWQNPINTNIPALIIASAPDQFYHKQREPITETKNGWILTKARFTIPEDFKGGEVKFYVWNNTNNNIYLDDFKVTSIKSPIEYDKISLDKINLSISEKNLNHLDSLKDVAFQMGRLQRTKSDYVKTKLIYNNDTVKGKIRLKGDLIDHLKKEKLSFRLKTKQAAILHLKKLNLQAPDTRWFINEYVYHEIMLQEGILCPRYRFVELMVNNKSWGIYALEEGLHKTMISQNHKPNGVLLKFDDNLFWGRKKGKTSEGYILKSKIKTYGQKSKDVIDTAVNILKKYQTLDSSYLDYFDLDVLAKYYALNDVMRGYHAMTWVNTRFFYNTETQLMEPVGYDAYPSLGYSYWAHPFLGFKANHKKYRKFETEGIIYNVFKNEKFEQLYYQYLNHYTEVSTIKKWLTTLEQDINFYEQQLNIEYPIYKYNRNFLFNNAELIRAAIDSNNQ